MRAQYNEKGVDSYYTENSNSYRNPHYPDMIKVVSELLELMVPLLHRYPAIASIQQTNDPCFISSKTLESTKALRILDLAAGSGEVSLLVNSWFLGPKNNLFDKLFIFASDCFTKSAFEERTGGWPCMTHSFLDVSNGILNDPVDICICSFALHLADESILYSLTYEIARKCRFFVIISPHKRPHIKESGNLILLKSFILNRIHVRIFESTIFELEE